MFLAFRICAQPIFSEKGRDVFLWGSAQEVSGQCGGTQYGRGKAKLFLLEEKDLLCLDSFFKTTGFCIRHAGGAGGMRGGFLFVFSTGG